MKQNRSGAYNSLCRAAAIGAYMLCAACFVQLGTAKKGLAHTELLSLAATAVFALLGYASQALFARLAHIKRVSPDPLGDDRGYFRPPLSFPSALAAVAAGIAALFACRAYMTAAGEFERFSLIPYEAAALAAALVFGGGVLWFFPYGKLISRANVITFTAIFVLAYTVGVLTGKDNSSFVTVCFVLYIASALFLINQGALERYFTRSGRSDSQDVSRSYNAVISLAVLVCLGIAFVISLSVVTGVTTALKGAFMAVARSIFGGGDTDYTGDEYPDAGSDGFQGWERLMQIVYNGKNPILTGILLVIFLTCIIFGILLLFATRTGRLGRMVSAVKGFFSALVVLIMRIFRFRFKTAPASAALPQSYRDEHVYFADSSHTGHSVGAAALTPALFERELSRRADAAEKYRYAYAVMLELEAGAQGSAVTAADTPREAAARLAAAGWDRREISDLTTAYELADYSAHIPADAELSAGLTPLCDRVGFLLRQRNITDR